MNTTPESTPSERDLVLRAQAGEGQAVAELYTRFWRLARATAYSVVGDVASAEDAAAEAFRIALTELGKLRDPARFAPWLHRIVLRTAMRQFKRRTPAAEEVEPPMQSDSPDPGQLLEQRELALIVSRAVERLPSAEREAIVLYYFEGFDSACAARFIDIPIGSFRRRLHDGRVRLRRCVTELFEGETAVNPKSTELHARVHALLSSDASPGEMYEVMREVLLSRPVPRELLATLVGSVSSVEVKERFTDLADRWLRRPEGPLFDDMGPVGETARVLRTALSDFEEWKLDSTTVVQALTNPFGPEQSGQNYTVDPQLLPPSFASGEPGRYVRVTRGLLFAGEGGAVTDLAALFVRSESLAAFRQGGSRPCVCDVLDVYWNDTRPIELSEVEAWVATLAERVVPEGQRTCSSHPGVRYRTALRLTFAGDPRPAAIGGVLTAWPGAPDGVHAVHVRLYLEPWAQLRAGRPVEAQVIVGRP